MLVPDPRRNPSTVVDRTALVRETVIVSRDDSALACSEILAGLKGEGCHVPERSSRAIFVLGTMGVGRVFNHDQVVPVGQPNNYIHFRRLPGEMHGNDRSCTIGNCGFNGTGIKIERFQINVDKDGDRICFDDC